MMRIVFFGTPTFAAHVLDDLIARHVSIVAVVSKPDRPKGRSGSPIPTPVKAVALKHGLPLYQPEIVSDLAFAPILAAYKADLFVVVAYGELIKQHLLDMPRLGCINLHASLLPKYRGAAPIQRCLINGETETGVTIMHMVRKMDAGDMIEKITVPIPPHMTFGELEQKLCEVGQKALYRVILDLEGGHANRLPQDHIQATFAPKIELEDCRIDWNQSAVAIHNLIRGTNPYPGAWCQIALKDQQKRLKILRSEVFSSEMSEPGLILHLSPLLIGTGQGVLKILEVQLEGKKAMPADEFVRGLSSPKILLI